MASFGYKLKCVREQRQMSLEVLAEAARIRVDRLRALEQDDLGALPDENTVEDHLRACAEQLHVNPDLMINDFRREVVVRSLRLVEDVAEEESPVDESHGPRFPYLLAASVLIVLLLLAGGWGLRSRTKTDPPDVRAGSHGLASVAPPAAGSIDVAPTERLPTTDASVESESTQTETEPEAQSGGEAAPVEMERVAEIPQETAPLTELIVTEHGVGSGVKNHRLVGESDRFDVGDRPWFWTRVEGGARGRAIDHVWIHEGVETSRVRLPVGGALWRTHSNKVLWEVAVGHWTVEARDESGRVLARSEFDCVR